MISMTRRIPLFKDCSNKEVGLAFCVSNHDPRLYYGPVGGRYDNPH